MFLSLVSLRPSTFCFCSQQGTVLTPTMDHAMSIQPTSMMGPLTQQLSHLSLGSTGTVSTHMNTLRKICTCNYPEMQWPIIYQKFFVFFFPPSPQYIPANTTMQGAYIPQFTPVPPSSVQEVGSSN